MNEHEHENDHIIVDSGELFDGTRWQFQNCFFHNAHDEVILDWAQQNKYNVFISYVDGSSPTTMNYSEQRYS